MKTAQGARGYKALNKGGSMDAAIVALVAIPHATDLAHRNLRVNSQARIVG